MHLRVLERARERGADLGFDKETVCDMAYRAAHVTHPIGNVRFDDYWFTVIGGEVLAMGVIGPGSHGGRVTFPDAIDCTYCGGTMRTIMVDDEDGSEEIIACPRMENRKLSLCSDP